MGLMKSDEAVMNDHESTDDTHSETGALSLSVAQIRTDPRCRFFVAWLAV
jgi:hypothetical protein